MEGPRHTAAVLRLVLPPALAVALFAAAVLWLIIPATAEALLERKRETLRAIVASAVSLCERHHAAELAGELAPAEARARAAADLRALRYGEGNRDYLWVIDHRPGMVVHPYRGDLEGRDLSGYADPDGVRLFAESVALVDRQGEGYIHYRWQRHDDSAHLAPKLSFVRGFAPWGWVVGSGIYLDDVQAETARTTRHLGWIAAAVGALVAALVALGLRQGWISERRRRDAEAELERSHARFQALAHASSEAVWLVVDGRIAAANRRAAELAGERLASAGTAAEALFADHADRVLAAGGAAGPRAALLAGADGPVPALVEAEPVEVQGRSALVLTARALGDDGAGGPEERAR
ncbi:MAG: cache domain-containing protein, partial [Planctomycetes bacterium]|nr:cache domain-containing protein [Planctomycetota bacterium]